MALLPAVLRRYAEDYPDVRIDISYTDKWVDPIAEGLDFAVRGGFPASSELLGARLWPYERLLCASPDYVARMGLPREPEDLVRHRLIMHTGPRVLRTGTCAARAASSACARSRPSASALAAA